MATACEPARREEAQDMKGRVSETDAVTAFDI